MVYCIFWSSILKFYCVFSLGKNWPPNCFVRRSQPTWSTLDSFTTDQYTWSSSAPTAAAHDMNFRSSNCLFLNLAFWRQFSSAGKLPWGQQHFLELLLLLLGKNRWGWQDASPVQFSFDGLDKKRIFHHHMAESIHLWSQLHPKYYPVKRAVFFCQAMRPLHHFLCLSRT